MSATILSSLMGIPNIPDKNLAMMKDVFDLCVFQCDKDHKPDPTDTSVNTMSINQVDVNDVIQKQV